MNTKQKGIMLVAFTALISGFSIFINSYGVKGFDSSVFTFSKNVFVALLLFSIILFTKNFTELKNLKKKNWISLIAIGFIGGSVPFLLFFKGLQLSAGAASSFIHKTIFIYVIAFAVFFLKEKITKKLTIGAVFILIGNYLMIKPQLSFGIGHLMILSATIMWAAENTYSKHVLKELSGNVVAFGRMFFGSLFILAFLFAANKTGLLLLNLQQLAWVLVTSALLLLYVITFYNGLKNVSAISAACILSFGSVVTTSLSFLFQNKAVALNEAVGMLLILAGTISIIMAHYSENESLILKVKSYGRN